MTLRDALAAALWRHTLSAEIRAGGNALVTSALESLMVEQADAILSDPTFREALVEAVERALHDMDVRDYQHRPKGTWIEALSAAHIIVARMLP